MPGFVKFDSPIPAGHTRFRVFGVMIDDKFGRHFTVPRFEIGILKAGWRGTPTKVVDTADFVDLPSDENAVYNMLVGRYGQEAVHRYHPGPERLGEDMARCAEETQTYIALCEKAADDENKRRVAAERASRAAVASANSDKK